MKLEDARGFALSLPEATEAPHFDLLAFRVRGKIFATVPMDGKHLHVFVDEHSARAHADQEPDACELLHWGEKLAGLRIRLAKAKAPWVRELIGESYARKAPKALLKELNRPRGSRPAKA